MLDLKEVNEALNIYLRLQSFPLAAKLATSRDEIPPRARQAKRDLGLQLTACQAWSIARHYGWTIAHTLEDEQCPYGAVALGFLPAKQAFVDGSFAEQIAPGTGEAMARTNRSKARLEYGKYQALILAPLHTATFEPDLLVIYGNTAQVMRLTQGRLWGGGGELTARVSGGRVCAEIFAATLLSDECQIALPCNGDRVFAMAQDHELAFTIPRSKIEQTIRGLEEGHKSGMQRYPIPSFLRFQARLPDSYYKVMEFLQQPG